MGYADTNDRDIRAKQNSSPASSAAFPDETPDDGATEGQGDAGVSHPVDPDDVKVLPGTGGPDDVGDIEVDPDELNLSGH
jgi:hypothetical protein